MGVAIRVVRCALGVVALTAAAAPVSAQTETDSGRSVLSGVYSVEQAAQGETVFKNVCANCHATSQFTGSAFLKPWVGRPVFSLFDQVRTAMPQDNPGGLTRAEYVAVVTYILKLNSFPAGTAELPDDEVQLKQIRFDTLSGSND